MVEFIASIDAVAAAEWNRLAGSAYPFLQHEFLAALERQGCLGERYGWLPSHLLIRDTQGGLQGALPLYRKTNSYGEFVFDWAWADAYQRAELAYYPKLVCSIPYTPASGPRLLTLPDADRPAVARTLIAGAIELTQGQGLSSVHWLFPTDEEAHMMETAGLLRRSGFQFHWANRGYQSFDDFLGQLTAKKRKQIRRERRRVAEAGITFRSLRGDEVSAQEWAVFHALYRSTFDKRGGLPTLSLGFFREIGQTLSQSVLVIFALAAGEIVASAFFVRGADTLFGRHWGCREDYHSLHFETCYYQGLEYCIANGLQRFEPGAQGEYKLSRGFLPTPTWSTHWIADPRFRAAIRSFLQQETQAMQGYLRELSAHSPYRQIEPAGGAPP